MDVRSDGNAVHAYTLTDADLDTDAEEENTRSHPLSASPSRSTPRRTTTITTSDSPPLPSLPYHPPQTPPQRLSTSSSVLLERLPPSPTRSLSDLSDGIPDDLPPAQPHRRGLQDIARICVGIASVRNREAERARAYVAAGAPSPRASMSTDESHGGDTNGGGRASPLSLSLSHSQSAPEAEASSGARWWPRGPAAPKRANTVTLAVGAGSVPGRPAPFASEVAIKGWQVVGGKSWTDGGKLGAYVVYDIDISLRSGTTISILRRYTEFVRLRDDLRRSFPHLTRTIPALPGKNHMSKFSPDFLEERRPRLQRFLRTVMLHPEMGAGGDDSVLGRWVLKKQ